MKTCLALLLISMCNSEKRQAIFEEINFGERYLRPHSKCIEDRDVVSSFRSAFYTFSADLYRKAAPKASFFLAMSPLDIWITLAAIAEGAEFHTQKEIFNLLNLPTDACSRQKLYQLATTRTFPNAYTSIVQNRALFIDEGVRINPDWYNLISYFSLLQVIPAPIKRNPATSTHVIQQLVSSRQVPNLKGNSVILNSMDYNGLWTTAFAGAVVERAPFYSYTGQKIGSVDLMRVEKQVRFGYVPGVNLKVIELPIGVNGEYSMIFALVAAGDGDVAPFVAGLNNLTIVDVLSSLQDSYKVIDVAIPRFTINTDINVRGILEELGVVNLWTDPAATRYISDPPAQPSSYIQRVSLTLNSDGIHPPPPEDPEFQPRPYVDQYWREFVADRPFMFALFDTESYTCLLATVCTQPTYPDV